MLVATACPELAQDTAQAALSATITNGAVARDLEVALKTDPTLLRTGAPAVVGRLVTELRALGAALPEPACARCGRTSRPLIRSGTTGVCGRCRAHELAEECSACGRARVVTARTEGGQALCYACAPRPARRCGRCGRTRPIARRAKDGEPDICDACFRPPLATCRVCGRRRPCSFVATGRPICASCSPRNAAPCAHCGKLRPPCARWPEGPVCEPCYRAALGRRGTCQGCGQRRRLVDPPGPGATRCADCAGAPALHRCKDCGIEDRLYHHRRCVRCALARRTAELLRGPRPELGRIYEAIVAARQPYSAHNWLRSAAGAEILSQMAGGALPVSHEALDAHPRRTAARFLRQVLVAGGVLAPRDEALVELETWVARRLSELADPARRRLLRSYATWRVLRRVRAKAASACRPRTAIAQAKNQLSSAITFLAWLDDHGLSLGEAGQDSIDTWATEGGPNAPCVRDFLDWAVQRKLIAACELASSQHHEGAPMDADTHFGLVGRLLHDDALPLSDRVAGCLVLLYGQQLSRIAVMTKDQVVVTADGVYVALGAGRAIVPEPLGGLLLKLAREGRPYVGVGAPSQQPWLFPGLYAGRPLHPATLGQRLRRLGVFTMAGRRAALLHLARHLPAAVLAELLNVGPKTAVHWMAAAGGDWSTYAAQVAAER